MAGMKPFFLTGANAKIKVNGKTLAYCTNLSYSVKVNHATPQVLGMYEPSSVEPLSYLVTGSFSVVRYIADAADISTGTRPVGTQNSGNGIGNWGVNNVSAANLADGRTYENLNPKKLHQATTFDIEVFQKVGTSIDRKTAPPGPEPDKIFEKPTPTFDTAPEVIKVQTPAAVTQIAVAKIRDVRITQADFSLSKKAVATQTFNFTALYADEDSFIADFSGLGQQFA